MNGAAAEEKIMIHGWPDGREGARAREAAESNNIKRKREKEKKLIQNK